MSRLLDEEEIERQLRDLPGWRSEPLSLRGAYVAPDFPAAVRFVAELADEAEQMDHHPDVDLRWRTVVLRCSTHSAGGVTQLDVELAHRAREWAERLGATTTQPPRRVELALDVRDPAAVLPFWREALAYQDASVGDEARLLDPHGAGFALRLRRVDVAGGEPGRFHLDAHVAPQDARPLVDRLVAQRGTVTDDAEAPQSWVVADAEGNECRIRAVGR